MVTTAPKATALLTLSFFPGQYYGYHWPIVHAGFRTINTTASDPKCGAPDGYGGITKLPGDWRETMSNKCDARRVTRHRYAEVLSQ